VKSINARAALIFLFLGLAMVTQAQAEEYYIYHDPAGKLVISNQEPPPGSKIIRQHNWPDATDSAVPQNQSANNPQANGPMESSPKPSKNK
jgi:hypothetical protein